MHPDERTSATGLEAHIRGQRLAASDDVFSNDVLVQIFTREEAKQLLLETEMSVIDVGLDVG